MRIAIILPDGISIRNYVYTGLLNKLRDNDLHILSEFPPAIVDQINALHGEGLCWHSIASIKENRKTNILRRICNHALLFTNTKIANNNAISDDYLNRYTTKSKRKLYLLVFRFAGYVVASIPGGLNKLETVLRRSMHASAGGKEAKRLLKTLKPDILFCTHQRSEEAGIIFNEAHRIGIKTITTIFSWDNLTKSRINYKADKYLLWSEHMKKDMNRFYPTITDYKLKITGTPQFDYYRNKRLIWSKEKFNAYFNIPLDRSAICFSGNEPTFPSDHLYLKDMLESLDELPIQSRPFVIVRPSPNDHTDRMTKITSAFQGNATVKKPEWQKIGNTEWVSNYPTQFDMEVLTNICFHCISMVNIGSTMAIDIAHFDKPAIYVNYIHKELPDYDLNRIYKQEHLKPITTLKAVEWVKDKSEWSSAIRRVLENTQVAAPERLIFKSLITDDITNAIDNIRKELTQA